MHKTNARTDSAPIVVVGNSRSGTSLLRLMLTCHPNICIPPEGPFLYALESRYRDVRDVDLALARRFVEDVERVTKMDEWGLDYQRLAERLSTGDVTSYADMVRAVYREFIETRSPGKRRWGDKSGIYTIHGLPKIRRWFPDAFVLHIVRDGRDIACSYRSLSGIEGKYAPGLPTDPKEIAWIWTRNLRIIGRFLNRWPPGQRLQVQYEELVTSPRQTLARICDAIGEDFDAGMLNYHIRNREEGLEPTAYLEWKGKTLAEVTDTQVARWREELSEEEVAQFQMLAGDSLERHGYQLEKLQMSTWKHLLGLLSAGLFKLRMDADLLFSEMRKMLRGLKRRMLSA